MRSLRWLAAFCLITAPIGNPIVAQTTGGEAAAVIATVQRLFDSFPRRDTVAMRQLLLPGITVVAMPVDGPTTAVRVQSDAGMIRSLGTSTERLLERMWQPVVKVDGSIATLSAPYDFHRNGVFSHCGTDTMTLMRIGSEWRIVGLAYTVQRDNCSPSPLGPPKA